MKKFTLTDENKKPCVMALGFFDGVHLGHKAVIEKAVDEAQKSGLSSAVFTFTASGSATNKTKNGEIYSIEKRLSLIENLGVDFALVPDFASFSQLSPREFALVLKQKFSVEALTCGADFRFGVRASGDVALLKALGDELGFEVMVVDAVDLGDERVSSSTIRAALNCSDLEKASKMLGRDFSIEERVVSGEHIGKKCLYPTINQPLCESFPLRRGVYATLALIDGKKMPAVTNIGVCPTVKKEGTPLAAETYILDETIELYGKSVEIVFKSFLRDENKFSSPQKLKEQITLDIKRAKEILV